MGVMFVARDDQLAIVAALVKELRELSDTVVEVDRARAIELNPVLRPDYVAAAAYDLPTAKMDVNAIHMGYLRKARADGAQMVMNAEVTSLEHKGGKWHVSTPAGEFAAPVVINAAGAWADVVAEMAGVRQIGLVPKRRTAFTFDPPAGHDVSTWTAAVDCEEQWYINTEGGQVLGSLADETPVPPQDVQPEEEDIALAVERIQRGTILEIKRINRAWAGLRSFVEDKCPVVGFAPDADGFFWLAGQGGYGIQTSWAMGLTARELAAGRSVPEKVQGFDVTEADLGPARLWR